MSRSSHPPRRRLRTALAGLAVAASTCLVAPAAAHAAPSSQAVPAAVQHLDAAARVRAYAAEHRLKLLALADGSCDDNTVMDQWLNRQMAQFTDEDLAFLDDTSALYLPMLEADLPDADLDSADFALGEDAQLLTKEFRKLQGFWDIDGSRIKLAAMHGQMLTDHARVARTYVAMGMTQAEADEMADYVVSYVTSHPVFQGGANPLLSLNAYSDAQPDDPSYRPRIIVGDGILKSYDEMGFSDVAAISTLAHEYGHQVQFAIGMITEDTYNSLEGVRRIELHADAEGEYFDSHPQGMSLQGKRVQEFLAADYASGDCYTTEVGHHGTPAQRQASGAWGYAQQEAARPRSWVQPSRTFLANFDKALPGILAAK